ncbi:hypothetical protein CIB48_g860 [Xylaria polymorpha]|nr:hypothetical protein CIB48_g860 [Xylaria polymorpha]
MPLRLLGVKRASPYPHDDTWGNAIGYVIPVVYHNYASGYAYSSYRVTSLLLATVTIEGIGEFGISKLTTEAPSPMVLPCHGVDTVPIIGCLPMSPDGMLVATRISHCTEKNQGGAGRGRVSTLHAKSVVLVSARAFGMYCCEMPALPIHSRSALMDVVAAGIVSVDEPQARGRRAAEGETGREADNDLLFHFSLAVARTIWAGWLADMLLGGVYLVVGVRSDRLWRKVHRVPNPAPIPNEAVLLLANRISF